MEGLVFLVIGAIFLAILAAGWHVLKFFFGGFYEAYAELVSSVTPTPDEWRRILEKEFNYYNKLPKVSKGEFVRRMKTFYHNKQFIGKGGMVVTERIKVLICASAAQLTFGLPRLQLPHFSKILIYPDKYLNKRTGKMHMGEMNSKGAILFSWEHIQKSLDDPDDGYNLLLHELAHAMRFEDYYPNEERHFLRQQDVNRLHILFRKMKGDIANGNIPFLNKYASSNFEEFIAVSVESFFERPVEFRKVLPDLYDAMRHFLNQDPEILETMNKKSM